MHLIGLVVRRRRALRLASTCEALIALAARARRRRTSSSTPSPTGATRSPTARRAATSRRSRAGAREAGTAPRRHASSAATSRWTATSAGTASSRPTTCSSTAAASTRADGGRGGAAPPTSAARPTSSSPRRRSATRRAIRPGDSVIAFNFRPDRMREITRALADPAFAEVDRGGAEPVERYATLTEYEEGWPYPVAFPPDAPERHAAARPRARGRAPAARRRDREVPARDVLLRRRRGGRRRTGERRELVPSPRDVPTYDHKPRDERARGGRRVRRRVARGRAALRDHQLRQRRHGRPHRRDPGRGRRRSRRSTAASARSSRRSRRPAARCVITADHGNADHMLEDDGSPNTAHSLNPVPLHRHRATGVALRDGGILADVAPTVLAAARDRRSPPEMTGRSLLRR